MSDMVIIPGTKNTIADLIHIRDTGLADSILKSHKEGKPVYGICGGYQMMGRDIKDPLHVEGNVEAVRGLDILPVSTTLSAEKRTVQCEFKFLDEHVICHGYEIHMGETLPEKYSPLTQIRGSGEGYYLNPLTWGTYVHGIFDNSTVVQHVLRQVDPDYTVKMDFRNFKEENYNKLADLVREAVDMDYIYKSMGIYK
jgi:adenosylcobyric acid synthase